MFELSLHDIHPGAQAEDKAQAIHQVAYALTQAGCVSDGYLSDDGAGNPNLDLFGQRYRHSARYYQDSPSGARYRRAGFSISAGN